MTPGGRPSRSRRGSGRRRSGGGAASSGGRRPPRRGGSSSTARSAARKELGGEQVEGRQAVRELLVAGRRRVREVLVAADADTRRADDLVQLATELRVPVRQVGRGKLAAEARTEAPQGVVAHAAPLEAVDLDELAPADADGDATPPFLVALDGITDPGNLGAVLRSAECAGVTGVVLPRHRAVHVTPAAAKAAAGAIEYLPMAVVGGLPAALGTLADRGYWVVGLDGAGREVLHDLAVADRPLVLVIGSEGRGLSRLVKQRCDVTARIPLAGHLDALNAAAAAAVACFEVRRRRDG